tara:strand:- start:111 stop:1250 length:1140 start_codon:yes stop_codon:yes gene_type:complete
MAITDRNTVLVLGAGATASFDYPLGSSLISNISDQISNEVASIYGRDDWGSNELRQNLLSASRSPDGFNRFPIHGAAARRHLHENKRDFEADPMNVDLERIKELQQLVSNQTSETIDDFIVENPSYSDLTKIAIAADFIKRSYKIENGALRAHAFEARYWKSEKTRREERNWIHLLINIVRHGIRSGAVSADNKVEIVTFNYDTVLERVLAMQFSNTESRHPDYSDYISILHVHGKCGEISDIFPDPAQTCINWSEQINVVNEGSVPDSVMASRTIAKEKIRSAAEIYFCGFSFSGPNCRLIGLGEPTGEGRTRQISVCNYDGNVGVSKTVSGYREEPRPGASTKRPIFTRVEEASGTIDKPLGISDWLKLGYLGELPG